MFADRCLATALSLTVALLASCGARGGRNEQLARADLSSRLCRWAHGLSSGADDRRIEELHAEATRSDAAFRCLLDGDALKPSEADRATERHELAQAYDRLADLTQDSVPRRASDDLRVRALDWSPTAARRARLAARLRGSSDPERAGYVRSRAQSIDADGSALWEALAIELADAPWTLVGSAGHELLGYVSLPDAWEPDRTYPILVGAEGAGCNFVEYLEECIDGRDDRDVIVVVPITLCNTNALREEKYPFYEPRVLQQFDRSRWDFDGPGVEALLAEVRRLYGGADQVLLAGYSGGGNYAYWKLLHTPDVVRGAVLSCANFEAVPFANAPRASTGGPPVRILLGRNDPHLKFEGGDRSNPGILPETELAEAALASHGYQDVGRVWADTGHRAMLDRVWAFVDEVLRR